MKTETMKAEVKNDKRAWTVKIADYRNRAAGHDPLDCECDDCSKAAYLSLDYIDTLHLTTDHAASSFGLPVLVDGDDIAYGTNDMLPIQGGAIGHAFYRRIAERDGWMLRWADCGNTLVEVLEQGK